MSKTKIIRLTLLIALLLTLLACSSGTEETAVPTEYFLPAATLAPTNTTAPTATQEEVKVSAIKNTNCRSGTSTDYPVETTLTAGTEVIVLGRNAGSDYYYVQNPDDPTKGCWVWSQLVTVIGDIEILPFFTPPPMIYPTAIRVTEAPACERSATISIKNDTGGQVTIYMTGTAKFTFYVAAGNQTISVCPGTYSYTAYGCGGASRSGTVSNGDEIEFWCE